MWRNREQISGYQRQVAGDGRNTQMVCLNKLSFKRKKSFKIGKIKKKNKRVKNMHGSCIYSQFNSVAQSYPTLCNPMNYSTPGLLSITNCRSSLKLTSIDLVMPSSHLILCHSLLLLPPIPPSIRVFSNESTLRMRWPKYWSFTFSMSPSKEHPGLISFRMD